MACMTWIDQLISSAEQFLEAAAVLTLSTISTFVDLTMLVI